MKHLILIPASIFVLAGCSGNSDDSNKSGSVEIPAYSKTISAKDEAEFLSAVDQASLILGQVSLDTNNLTQAIQDIEAYSLNQRGVVVDRSDLTQYGQLVQSSMSGCKFRSKTESTSSGVSTQTVWSADASDSENCTTTLSGANKTAASALSEMDHVQTQNQSVTLGWNKGLSFASRDFVSMSADVNSNTFNRQGRSNDFVHGSKSEETFKASFTFSMKNGQAAKLEVGRQSQMSTKKLDDVETKTTGSSTLTLVFNGTKNPIVYQRTDTVNASSQTTVITVNGTEVFRSPRK